MGFFILQTLRMGYDEKSGQPGAWWYAHMGVQMIRIMISADHHYPFPAVRQIHLSFKAPFKSFKYSVCCLKQ